MKKMMTVLGLVLAIVCLVPSFCLGAWVTANVDSLGVGGTFTYVALTDTATPPAFGPFTYFVLDNTGVNTNKMVATGLTAISLHKTTLCWVDDVAPYSNLSAMYLNQ